MLASRLAESGRYLVGCHHDTAVRIPLLSVACTELVCQQMMTSPRSVILLYLETRQEADAQILIPGKAQAQHHDVP